MGPKKQPTKKSKKDGKKKAKAKDPEPLVEMIDLDEQLAKGGNVPALINHAPEETPDASWPRTWWQPGTSKGAKLSGGCSARSRWRSARV